MAELKPLNLTTSEAPPGMEPRVVPDWVPENEEVTWDAAGRMKRHDPTPKGPNEFYGVPAPRPVQVMRYEKPWHKIACHQLAAGSTIKEVSEALEVSTTTVRALLRNRWFQDNLSALISEMGKTDIMEVFRNEAVNSMITLVEIRDNTKCPAAVRKAAASDILDRFLGKATQKIESHVTTRSEDPVAEVAELEEEKQRLLQSTTGGLMG